MDSIFVQAVIILNTKFPKSECAKVSRYIVSYSHLEQLKAKLSAKKLVGLMHVVVGSFILGDLGEASGHVLGAPG